MMTEPQEHSPLEAYQWSAAKVDYTTRFVHRLGLVLAVIIFVCAVATMVWNSANVNAKVSCETAAFNNIIGQLSASHQATVEHKPIPNFTYPKPC